MKYTLKIIFVILAAAALLIGVIWIFSSTERQFALNQYIEINKTSSNAVQNAVQDNIAKWTDEGGNVDYVGLVNSLPKHDFNSVSILNKNGTVIASTDDSIKGAYINSLGDKAVEAFYEKNGAYILQNGNAYYFAQILSDDYRVMCIILQSSLLATQTKISLINIVEVLILLLIASIAITLTIIFYKQKFNVLYKVKPVNNYTLSTTKNGKLLYADKNFKETFKNVKFTECFIDKNKPLREALTSGNLLLFSMKNKNDETRKIAFNATRGLNEYKLVGSDVTSFMEKYDKLLYEFETDSQTGLSNIIAFERDWDEFLKSKTFQDGLMCFFGIPNLDYYRTLYGEESFLKGLKFVSKHISDYLEEYGRIYSVKGNVFLLVKTKELKDKFVRNIEKIQAKLSESMSIYGNLIKLDVRLGVIYLKALRRDTNFDYVLSSGARALKVAKEIEDVPYYVQRVTTFDSNSYHLVTNQLITELTAKGSIDLYFQPQVDAKKEKVVGFEALFRLVDPAVKDMSVFEFIASAEKHGCIVQLGEFIYKKAMDFACLVQKYDLTVSINISPIQLMQMGFVEKFLDEYKNRNIKPGIVHVEIVEGTMIYSISDVIQKLKLLEANGIYSEIDDFGIAYSSMLYLKQLPITTIKIDKAFVDNIENNEKDRNLIKNIINITKDFGLKSIAEGVERKGQRDILEKLGCDIIQGYYYAQAMPKEKVFEYLKKMNKDVEEKL